MERLLSELEGSEAAVVRLYHLDGKSYQEISSAVGIPENSVLQYEEQVKKKPPMELIVAREELAGHIQVADGSLRKGLKTLENVSKTQRKLRYSEPAWYPRPVAEALGEVAAKHGKRTIAESAFRTCLEDMPSSVRSVNGLKDLRPKQLGE